MVNIRVDKPSRDRSADWTMINLIPLQNIEYSSGNECTVLDIIYYSLYASIFIDFGSK